MTSAWPDSEANRKDPMWSGAVDAIKAIKPYQYVDRKTATKLMNAKDGEMGNHQGMWYVFD